MVVHLLQLARPVPVSVKSMPRLLLVALVVQVVMEETFR